MSNHIMIDFETLDVTPSSVVLSVGLTAFTDKEIVDTMYIVPNHQQQLDLGRTISMDTLKWWMNQSEDAKKVFSAPQVELLSAVDTVHEFLSKHPNALLWSNGSNFDEPILNHLLSQANLKSPLKFWNSRCLRTYGAAVGKSYSASREKSPTHNALEDAIQQTQYLLNLWNTPVLVKATEVNGIPVTVSKEATFKIGRRK